LTLIIQDLHPWNVTPKEAVHIQLAFRDHITASPPTHQFNLVAGADVSYCRKIKTCFASVVVMDIRSMEVIDRANHADECLFPYVPGLLTFREGPPLLAAFSKLKIVPEVVIFDGQGQAHPRGMGLAAHLGLFLELPTVGCAKTRLIGTHKEVGPLKGEYALLMHDEQVIGAAVRTRFKTKPLYVSPGHHMDLAGAISLIMRSCTGYRIPEPLRVAHQTSNRLRLGK
jgi:deoxyribonuclease V